MEQNKDLCVWYKSQSITENNKMYELCHQDCDGLNKLCDKYLSQKELEKMLMIQNISGDYKCEK